MRDQSHGYTLDDALTFMGFGKFQGLALAFSGLGWFAEAMEIMILSFVGSAVKSEWGLSSSEESIITTVVFAGMLVGSYSWGLISDNFGRRKSILGGSIVTSVAGLLSAFSPNYVSLLIFRGLAGVGLGCVHVFFSWFLEFVPPSNRGKWMIVFSTFWTFGSVSEAGLAWIVMPRLNWRWLLALSAIPSFIVLIFVSFVPESPRYLCTKGRITDAHNILEKIALFNKTSLPSGSLISDGIIKPDIEFSTPEETPLPSSTRNITTKLKSGFSSSLMLFSRRLLRTTILLWILFFGNSFVYYGIVLLTSALSGMKSKCSSPVLRSKNVQDARLYVDVFITSSAELPGLLLAAIIVDRLGRKPSMTIMFGLVCIFLLPLVTHQSNILTTALLFGARMCSMGTFTIAYTYAPEIYPTSMRSTGAGVANAMGKIGGMVCPLVAVGLVTSCHQTAAIILLVVVIVVSVVSILLIPFETKGKELSDTIDGLSNSRQVLVVRFSAAVAGTTSAVGRIGGMVCPLVAVGLVTGCHRTAAIVLLEVVIVVSVMRDQSHGYMLDDALTFMGFGKFQGLALAFSGLGWFVEAMEIMILSFVGSAVKSEWGLSSSEESIITTVVFAGMLVGSYSWGLISDNYGRRKSILGGSIVTSVAGLLSAFSPNYVSLVIFRGLAGAGLGCGHVFFSWFLEFVPPSNRGLWMIVFSTFWTFGSVSEAGLAWIVMQRLNWRWLLALSAIPSFILLIFISFMPESPRYLCTKGRLTDANNILEKIALINGTCLPSGSLISDGTTKLDEEFATSEETPLLISTRNKSAVLKSGFSSFLMLFSTRLFRTTILLWILYFGNSFVYYGIVLLTSALSSMESKCSSPFLHSESVQDDSLYIDVFINSFAELPGLVLAAIIVDREGRKSSMTIMFVLVCIFLLPLATLQSNILTTALLFGARMCSMGTFTIAYTFCPEIYPTSMRSTGAGVANAMGKIGGMVCPLVAVGLVTSCHQTAAIILLVVVIVVSVVSILLIPFETKGKELSDTIDGLSNSRQVLVVR